MPDYRDHHATIFLPPEIAGPIEAARQEWDPSMASRIAAHVTLAYPQEAPNSKLLFERVREASDSIGPLRLRLGGVACFERPEYGVYVEVEDIDGGYGKMREHVLRPPFRCLTFPAHVTLVHPQTSRRGRGFCERGAYQRQSQEFTAREIAVTAFDGVRWAALETYGLVCRPKMIQETGGQAASNSTLQRTEARDARLGR
jgi:2'-5' RNA ligase